MVQKDGKFTTIPFAKPLQMVRPDLRCCFIPISEDETFEDLVPKLCPRDRDMATRLGGSRRQAFLTARRAIATCIDDTFLNGLTYDQRRPIPPKGHVSISHSRHCASAIYHPNLAVGIDIEGPRPELKRIATKFLNDADRQTVADHDQPEWALRVLWGAKEALFKAAQTPGLIWAHDMVIHDIPTIGPDDRLRATVKGREFDIIYGAIHDDCWVIAAERPQTWHVVITGPESCGKSTLTAMLAEAFQGGHVEEYARAYLMEHGAEYTEEQVAEIWQGQRQAREHALSLNYPMVFSDTDALNFCVWTDVKYGRTDEEIRASWRNSTAHLHLLCTPDLPWAEDELRENPKDRHVLHGLFMDELHAQHMPFVEINGRDQARYELAKQAIEDLLGA